MRRVQLVVCLGIIVTSLASSLRADEYQSGNRWHKFWQRTHLDFRRNNAWPEPFQHTDRQSVRMHWMPYVVKGWQQETTLTPFDFDPDSKALTRSGEEKVFWITTQAPPERRTVFVPRGYNQEVTESRVDLVQQAIAQIQPVGPPPAVVRTHAAPGGMGSTGGYVHDVWQKFQKTITPTLPAASSTGGSGN